MPHTCCTKGEYQSKWQRAEHLTCREESPPHRGNDLQAVSVCPPVSSLSMSCAAGDRAEGAEEDLDNAPASNNNISSSSSSSSNSSSNSSSTSSFKRSFSLESRFSFLNLRRPRGDRNADSCSQKTERGQTVVLVKGVWGTVNKLAATTFCVYKHFFCSLAAMWHRIFYEGQYTIWTEK